MGGFALHQLKIRREQRGDIVQMHERPRIRTITARSILITVPALAPALSKMKYPSVPACDAEAKPPCQGFKASQKQPDHIGQQITS
jgi:hypothetical protein